MNSRIITGIDLGTQSTRVLITEYSGSSRPKILGAGVVESRGITKGYVTNIREAATTIRSALNAAEEQAGIRVNEVYVAIGGLGLDGIQLKGEATASRSDSIFTDNEIDRCNNYAQNRLPDAENKVVLHNFPIAYFIDGKFVPITSPIGLKGLKLEVQYLYITILKQHHDAVRVAMHEAGVDVINFYPAPIATGSVALSRKQLTSGAVLVDIGAETTSLITFENQIPISLQIFDIGSNALTGDLARGLHVSIEEAEEIKLGAPHRHSNKKIVEIYHKHIDTLFSLVASHIKLIDRDGRLPGGLVVVGGGSQIPHIDQLASPIVDIYTTTDTPLTTGQKSIFEDTSFLTVYGLCMLAIQDDYEQGIGNESPMKKIQTSFKNLLHQLLP